MKDVWFYLKLILIGFISPLLILTLIGLISSLLGIKDIEFILQLFGKENITDFLFKILIILHDFVLISMSAAVVLFIIYLFFPLDLRAKRNITALITSLCIFLFAYLAPYVATELIHNPNLPVYFDLLSLCILILLNIFIIFMLSKRSNN